MIRQFFTLPGGVRMPTFGLGTWQAQNGKEVLQALEVAIETGYRQFDTASIYGNEAALGSAFKSLFDAGKVKREDVFITTKLPFMSMSTRKAIRDAFQKSLGDLQMTYIDLYLVHSPMAIKMKLGDRTKATVRDMQNVPYENEEVDLRDVWKAMEELVDEGRVRAIGVSNFNARQITHVSGAARIPIATNQVELHVYLQQRPLVEFCRQRNILITAFAPLGSPALPDNLWKFDTKGKAHPLENTTVISVASKHNKTPAQVLIRFVLQQDVAVLPKSSNPKRIKENIEAMNFELDHDDMQLLAGLDYGVRYFSYITSHNMEHPEYPFYDDF